MTKELLGSLELNRIYQRECIEGMKMIPDKSIDMILCDLPYGTTACKWDTIIPFEPLWEQYERVIKENGAIVLTASQPFTSALVMSNPKLFRYEFIWHKERPTDPLNAKRRIMRYHENVLIFYKKQPTYNPIMEEKKPENKRKNNVNSGFSSGVLGIEKGDDFYDQERYRARVLRGMSDFVYPNSVKRFNMQRGLHPTQKPVALFEYLIKTYSNEGEIVLDNCMGSGTTAVSALNTGRNFVGFELETEYVQIANQRLESIADERAERELTEEK